jgi:hypothetical protein
MVKSLSIRISVGAVFCNWTIVGIVQPTPSLVEPYTMNKNRLLRALSLVITVYTLGMCPISSAHDADNWGPHVFDRVLDELGASVTKLKGSDEDKIKSLLAEDARNKFFRLAGLAGLYEDVDKKFSDLRDQFKAAEEALGNMALNLELKTKANGDQKLADEFDDEYAKNEKNFLALMKEYDYLDDPAGAIRKLHAEIDDTKVWEGKKSGRKFLVRAIMKHASEVQDDIEKDKFNDEDLDNGLHKLRRSLRWISISFQALDGFVTTRAESVASDFQDWNEKLEKEMATDNISGSKYLRIGNPKSDVNPIIFPKTMTTLIANLVALIGHDKDSAESNIHLGKKVKESKKAAQQEAVEYEHLLKKTDLLNQFNDALEKANL